MCDKTTEFLNALISGELAFLDSENLTQSSNEGEGCHGESYLYLHLPKGSLKVSVKPFSLLSQLHSPLKRGGSVSFTLLLLEMNHNGSGYGKMKRNGI